MADVVRDVDFVKYVVESIVDHPEAIQVDRTVDERGVLITLKVDPRDMGYVIGRDGQNARAIRILLRIVGARNNSRVNLKIFEPEGSQRFNQDDRRDRGGSDSNSNQNRNDQDIDTSAVDLKI